MKKRSSIMKNKKYITLFLIFLALIVLFFLGNALIQSWKPKLLLNGEKTVIINYLDTYKEQGVTLKNKSFEKEKLTIKGTVDTHKLGTYVIQYNYQDGKLFLEEKRIVKVVDNEAPIITLVGKQEIEVVFGDTYIEPGYKVLDNYDGDITKQVTISGTVNTKKVGVYSIVYSVKDASSNGASMTRTVKVVDKEAPVIEFEGANLFLIVGSSFKEPGYRAFDNVDGDITKKVVVKNNVNASKVGTYYIEYNVTDSSGNKTTATRRVTIIENTKEFHKNIYLTFDDGPSAYTPELLRILKEKKVKATFFVSPNKGYYKYLKDIVNDGHELAIHGYHDYKKLYSSSDTFMNYFYSMQNDIKKETGITVRNFRFPGGSNTVYLKRSIFDEIKKNFNTIGVVYYDWNVSSEDATGKYMSKDAIADTVFRQVIYTNRKENVILMHDAASKKATREALPAIIDTFKNLGYEFKVMDDCSFAPQFRS